MTVSSGRLGFVTSAGQPEGLLTSKTLRGNLKGIGDRHMDVVDLPPLTGNMLVEVVRRKKITAGSLDGWGLRELAAFPAPWFDGLARIPRLVEADWFWPEGLLDAYIAWMPKALVRGRCVCCLWSKGCGRLRGWCNWSLGSNLGCLIQYLALVEGGVPLRSFVEAWFSAALDIEDCLTGAVDTDVHLCSCCC